MLLGTDELTILRGSKFYGTWQWINSVTGDPEDFAGLTATIKIKNIHEDFKDVKNTFEVGTATVEPLDVEGNAFKGRIDIELSKEDTLFFAIPDGEIDKYGASDFYAVLSIALSTGEVALQAKVRIVNSIENESLEFLIDNVGEAIIIKGKLDNILLRNDEYIATRDNLIDVVIPTAIQTYNDNHNEKLVIYNNNHNEKLLVIDDLVTTVSQDKDIVLDNKLLVSQDKDAVSLMKVNVQENKDAVDSMKTAIETIFDNFDDRFLGVFAVDPIVDNDGEALNVGAIYYNSTDKEIKFYNDVSWDSPQAATQTYALQASQSASAALSSENNAKASENNAKASEDIASEKANAILNLVVETTTLAPGATATSSFDGVTGILSLGIPSGLKGDKGDAFVFEDFTQAQIDDLVSSVAATNTPDLPISKVIDLQTTLDAKINISDIKDNLVSPDTNKPLSANQGLVLKGLIDDLNTILLSDDTTLDEIQEIVNYIKQNKSDLQNLDLSNIAETTTLKHFTQILKDKLDSIEENATNYVHPSSHDASMIVEDSTHRFVSDSEKTAWNAKSDFSGNYEDLVGKPLSFQAEVISQPAITAPTTGTINYIGSITSSTYVASSTYKGILDYVEWNLATDAAFTNIVHTKNDSLSLSYTPQNTSPSTQYYVRVRYGSDNHLSNWSIAINFTTPAAVIYSPTITSPTTGAIDLGKTVAITSSAYAVFGHTEPQLSADWQIATDVNFTTIVGESPNDTVNKTSWTTPNLTVSTQYYVRVRYKSITYTSAYSNPISFTTKAQFTPTIGTQGSWGFGVAPTDEPFAVLGLAEMTGTNTVGHANYGNYIHTNGSIVCWNVKGFYRIGHASSPRYAVYGPNAIDIVGTETFANETEANAGGYVLPRVFINNGAEKSGYFQDKYMNSKDGTTAGKSVFGGNPIGMTTNATYNPSSTMTGCTGILADAVTLSRARGSRWNCSSAFMYAWAAMVSVAHGQATTSTANCAWYDATLTTNFPKGCNNGALSDTNDATVVYAASPDTAAKPKTGATSNFNKTTHNGCANGIADLNGGLYEVLIGITNYGTSATDTTAITNDTIYVLKTTVDHASLTAGWDGATDAWGAAATLASRFDAVTSPHPLGSSTGTVYWGNGANAAFSADASGVNRSLCGFIPKDSSASNATGINMLGNDYFYRYGRTNQVPLCCGDWSRAATAGLFYRHFYDYRSADSLNASFRASAYFG